MDLKIYNADELITIAKTKGLSIDVVLRRFIVGINNYRFGIK